MKKKASPKKNTSKFGAGANRLAKKATPKKAMPAFGKRPKTKIPSLGSGMMGLGATGAQGMMP